MARRISGIVYGALTVLVALFQIALALGMPWGAFAMGGAFPAQFPPAMRAAALGQAVVLLLLAGVILSRAGIILPKWAKASRWLAWVVVAFSALSLVLNIMTPSAGERLLWAPDRGCRPPPEHLNQVVLSEGPRAGPSRHQKGSLVVVGCSSKCKPRCAPT